MKTILALLLSGMTALGVDVYITNITIQSTCDSNLLVLGMTNINAPTRLINGTLLLNAVAVPTMTGATNNLVSGPITTATNNLLKTVTNVVGILPAPLATNLVNAPNTTNLYNYTATYLGGLTSGRVIGTSIETSDLVVSGPVPITDVASTNNPILLGPLTLGLTNNGTAVLNGNVGIGTNNPQAALHVFATNSPYAVQVSGVERTNLMTLTTAGVFTASSSIAAGANVTATWLFQCGDNYGFRWGSTGTKLYSPTNGTMKIADTQATQTGVSNGATLLLDPVQSFPFPTSSKGVLTNNQWGIGNTNGTLTFMTANAAGTGLLNPLTVSTNSVSVNALQMLASSVGPAFITNGAAAFWMSNGGYVYLRQGPTGYTTNKDTLISVP